MVNSGENEWWWLKTVVMSGGGVKRVVVVENSGKWVVVVESDPTRDVPVCSSSCNFAASGSWVSETLCTLFDVIYVVSSVTRAVCH